MNTDLPTKSQLLISCLIECNLRREFYLGTKRKIDMLPDKEVSNASNYFGGLNYILKVDFLGHLGKLAFGKYASEITIQNLLKEISKIEQRDSLIEKFRNEQQRLEKLFYSEENWVKNPRYLAVRNTDAQDLLNTLVFSGREILESSLGKSLKKHRDKVFAHFDVDANFLENNTSPKISYVFDFIITDFEIVEFYRKAREWTTKFYLLVNCIDYNFDWIETIGTKYSEYLEEEAN